MKKVMSLMMVFSVVFMGMASTLAQSFEVASAQDTVVSFDAFGAELSEEELAEIDGQNPLGWLLAGYAAGKIVDNIPTKGGTSTVGEDVNQGIQKGFEAAEKRAETRAWRKENCKPSDVERIRGNC